MQGITFLIVGLNLKQLVNYFLSTKDGSINREKELFVGDLNWTEFLL